MSLKDEIRDMRMDPPSGDWDESLNERTETIGVECPHCGYNMTSEEYESVCDCGCPSCRKAFEYDETL